MKDVVVKRALIESLRSGNSIEVEVEGMSMYPVIRNGDLIKILPLAEKEYPKPGDILAIDTKTNWLVVHRLIRLTNKNRQITLFIKGDAKSRLDPPCQIDSIIGKVVSIKRRGRLINLNSSFERMQAIVITGISVFFPDFLRISRFLRLSQFRRFLQPKILL